MKTKSKTQRLIFALAALVEFVMYGIVLDALWSAPQKSIPAIVFMAIVTIVEAKSCSDELKQL